MDLFNNNQEELSSLKEEVRSLQAQVNDIMQRLEPSAEEAPEEAPVVEAVEKQPDETCTDGIKPLMDAIATLSEKVEGAIYQEGIMRDMHEELQRYKKGLLAEIAKGYVMDIVRIYDHLADTNSHFNPESPDFDAVKVKRLLENNLLSISDMLEDQYSVECFTPAPGDAYQPKEHKAMRIIESDDESLASTVAECLGSGFRYADGGKLLRQARVVVYKKK